MKQEWSPAVCERLLKFVKLNKNVSYHKALGKERKYLNSYIRKREIAAIEKSFMENWIKNRKYFSACQYQTFKKFRHYTSAMKQNRFIQRNKQKMILKKRYSTNLSSSRPVL